MIRNRIYYFLKPLLPPPVRLAIRRRVAQRQRADASAANVWPILSGSEAPPAGWTGWPDGKRFALLFTHDIEGRRGLDCAPALARMLLSHGFRSAFNFIPEGRYAATPEIRHLLERDGFEVGVHDLHHDGRLYSSRADFARKALLINSYLHEWNARGFRSGFMLNRLHWLHDLDIAYDSSTFDTDPFEPQPHGCHTIFPFWVPNRTVGHHSGYVELPYTLPQDSTLFLLLEESNPAIWLSKLDWIAERGGMALVNIHPDYIAFDNNPSLSWQYSASLVDSFLQQAAERHAGAFWNPLPRELAEWYRQEVHPRTHTGEGTALPPKPFRGRRAAVLLYSHYPSDPRPRRAAEALAENGMDVDLVCLREDETQPGIEVVRGVNVHRVPLRKSRASKWTYIRLYAAFIAASRGFLLERCESRPYDLVHVHNMPDVLVFAASPAKRRGARVLLDLHDPMPELMMAIYGLRRKAPFVRLLRLLERWSLSYADLALTPNLAFQRLFASRSCPEHKVSIVMNSPQEDVFSPAAVAIPPLAAPVFRIMHHGSIVHRHGVDLLVRALPRIRERVPSAELHIYGTHTLFLDEVLHIAGELGVSDAIMYHGAKSQPEIAAAIAECHAGVIPNRRSEFTDMNLPTRIFEYLAMHRPVVAPDTPGIRDYFTANELKLFPPGDIDAMADALISLHARPEAAAAAVARGRSVLERHAWQRQKHAFLGLIADLLSSPATSQK